MPLRQESEHPTPAFADARCLLLRLPFGLSPDQLRPLSVLQHTSKYLVKNVFAEACENSNNEATSSFGRTAEGKGDKGDHGEVPSIASAYVFVEDRLRAVRQDLTVQGLGSAAKSAEVLKLAANFYVVSGYLMSDKVGYIVLYYNWISMLVFAFKIPR